MPLESGGRQKMMSGETPQLQNPNPRTLVYPDIASVETRRTAGQTPVLDLNLGAGREDIDLGQGGQPQEQAYLV